MHNLIRKAVRASTLARYRILRYRSIPGFLSALEAIALYRIARRLPQKATVVEIGSWKGKSTFCLAKGLKSGRVYAIDPFDASGDAESALVYEANKGGAPLLQQFQEYMRQGGVLHKIEPLVGTSSNFLQSFTSIDLLFIDGDHSIAGCDFDYSHFSPHIAKGGYIAFHDFGEGRDSVGPNWVIEHKVLPSGEYTYIGLFDSLWVAQKI